MAAVSWALKEWAIAVEALLAGDLVLLIRKGGIRESKPFFEVPSDHVLLLPTYEHQKAEVLRQPYEERLTPRSVPDIGAEILLPGWAHITQKIQLPSSFVVQSLHPFHIWTDDWFAERLAWKPQRPAYALLLKAYQFSEPISLSYQAHHTGCRSWINLDLAKTLPESTPVLSDTDYLTKAAAIESAIAATTA